jgi:FMN-dependent NADH-azoreductase
MRLLHIDSSIKRDASVSRSLTREAVAEFVRVLPSLDVDYLDVAEEISRHFTHDSLGIKYDEDREYSQSELDDMALFERYVDQFLAANVVLIGAPLYNFFVPTQLKTWIDRITQKKKMFAYTENGPVGLAGNKTIIVVSVRGGLYKGKNAITTEQPQERVYLGQMFGFYGITDIRFACADGTDMGDDAHAAALKVARDDIKSIVSDLTIAGLEKTGSPLQKVVRTNAHAAAQLISSKSNDEA